MQEWDIFQPNKYLVRISDIVIETSTLIDDEYFKRLIDKSWKKRQEKHLKDRFRLAGISYMNNHYFHPDVNCISDGSHEVFIPLLEKGIQSL